MRSVPSIAFDVRPSRLVEASVVVMATLALIGLCGSRLPSAAIVVTGLALAAAFAHHLRRQRRPPLAQVAWHADAWQVRLPAGEEVAAELRGHRLWGPLIVLRLVWDGGRAAVLLMPDNLDVDVRRRLRMRLSALADRP